MSENKNEKVLQEVEAVQQVGNVEVKKIHFIENDVRWINFETELYSVWMSSSAFAKSAKVEVKEKDWEKSRYIPEILISLFDMDGKEIFDFKIAPLASSLITMEEYGKMMDSFAEAQKQAAVIRDTVKELVQLVDDKSSKLYLPKEKVNHRISL